MWLIGLDRASEICILPQTHAGQKVEFSIYTNAL